MQELIKYCQTDRQRQVIEAMVEHGSERKAAAALGCGKSAVHEVVRRVNEYFSPKEVPATKKSKYRKHFVIPDVQAKPGVPLKHLEWAGRYAAEKRPDVIVCIGDFADMPSLSLYDRGKKSFEGRRYKADIEAAHKAMETLMAPIVNEPDYKPELILVIGNHEHRITRATEDDSKLDGTIGLQDLGYEAWGWKVIPFLEVVEIDGVSYSHYFYNPNSGKPYAGTAHTKLKNIGMTFVMGHQQGFDYAAREIASGKKQIGVVAGSFYQHKEVYKGPQGNGHWNGCLMLHEVKDGEFDLMQVSLDYLRRRYSK